MCGYKKTSEQHFFHSDVFPVAPPASLIIYLRPYQRKPNDFRGLLVRVVRLERTVSWSQTFLIKFFYFFRRFIAAFALLWMLFATLDSTVSAHSTAVCSQTCGQKPLSEHPRDRGQKAVFIVCRSAAGR